MYVLFIIAIKAFNITVTTINMYTPYKTTPTDSVKYRLSSKLKLSKSPKSNKDQNRTSRVPPKLYEDKKGISERISKLS